MACNEAHQKTSKAILELYGVSHSVAKGVADLLVGTDNNAQDQLIQQMVCDDGQPDLFDDLS